MAYIYEYLHDGTATFFFFFLRRHDPDILSNCGGIDFIFWFPTYSVRAVLLQYFFLSLLLYSLFLFPFLSFF